MKVKSALTVFFLMIVTFFQLGMGRSDNQYDLEARQAEREAKRAQKQERKSGSAPRRFVGGVKEATVGSTAGLLEETADETADGAPIVGTIEGARKGTETVLDKTVKGVAKVATLGYGDVDHYEVVPPEKGSSEDTGKIKIKIPGT